MTVTFPDGYDASTDSDGNTVELSGKEAVFRVTVNSISEPVTPELTDEWVDSNFGISDDLHTADQLRSYLNDALYATNYENAIGSQGFLLSLFYTAFGIGPVFAAAVVCFWLTALLECMIHLEYQKPPRTAGIGAIVREDLALSAHFLRREQPDILKLLLLAALAGMFVSGTAVVGFPYLVRTVLGLSATYYGAAESAMGAAAILGSLCAGLLGKKLRVRDMAAIFLSFGLSLFPIGLSFLLPVGRMARYGVLLFFFCVCQLGVCIFSTYAITLIQQRTPEQLMGKVMSCVFTLSMCAQPVGQVVYGALFDCFSDRVYWVLIPTGVLICLIAVASRGFLKRMEAAE